MTLTLDLPADVAARLTILPERERNEYAAVALSIGMDKIPPGPLTAAQMMALPFAVRERLFAAQAEEMAAIYEADLALPPEERELTAFSSFDEPFREPEEYLAILEEGK